MRVVSIEHDERDFWHVNFFEHEDHDVPDAFVTTKKGATLADAVALARLKFPASRITVWETCGACGGSGVYGDTEDDWCECDECEDGMVSSNI